VVDADEIFSSGNFSKAMPATRIDGRELQSGPHFIAANDGHGGTKVTLGPPPVTASVASSGCREDHHFHGSLSLAIERFIPSSHGDRCRQATMIE
jgi:hypothetical protein